MDREEALKLLKGGPEGVAEWNKRRRAGEEIPSLEGADLRGARLSGAYLNYADLSDANLIRANLHDADLVNANLLNAKLCFANLIGANLNGTNLTGADLRDADLRGAKLGGAHMYATNVACDLREVEGLGEVRHHGLSHVDVNALRDFNHSLPEKFLRGCGLSPYEVVQARLFNPRLNAAELTDLQYKAFDLRTKGPLFMGGVFISYSHADSGFADKVYDRLMAEGANVWLDRHDMVAGPLDRQVTDAIRLNDILLVVLSKTSIASDWVELEIETAREKEKKEGRDVLCPVALDDSWLEKVKGSVLWRQVKKKNVLDFGKWKTKAFNAQFAKLLKGMKIYYPPKAT